MKPGIPEKKLAIVLLAFFSSALVFSQESKKYVISNAQYLIDGISSETVTAQKYPLDYGRQFESQEELEEYLDQYRVSIFNERNFQSAEVEWETVLDKEQAEPECIPVTVTVRITDSKHFLALPYIKYDSNTGLGLNLKAKDTNFLGRLEEFNLGLCYEGEEVLDGSGNIDRRLMTDVDFVVPFQTGVIQSRWVNDYKYAYDFDGHFHDFDLMTGFQFFVPVGGQKIALDIRESMQTERKFAAFDDSLFYTTEAELSVPFVLRDLGSAGKIHLSPLLRFVWNYDGNGISKENRALNGPEFFAGASLDFGQVNWDGNLRNGLKGTANAEFLYNLSLNEMSPQIQLDLLYFKSLGFMGFNLKGSFFLTASHPRSVGPMLRGIKDIQYHTSFVEATGIPHMALSTEEAFILNMDFPFSLLTLDWNVFLSKVFGEESAAVRKLSFMSLFNLELQVSPFVDIGFIKEDTVSVIGLPDRGLCAAGVEVIVFPEKWRSYAVRASYGVDLGQTVLSSIVDSSWKRSCLPCELFVGLGLHF